MGKTKTKYPVDIIIEFFLPLTERTCIEKEVRMKINSPELRYEDIRLVYEKFLEENRINYPTYMAYMIDEDKFQIGEDFRMEIPYFLDQFGGRFNIIVQNELQFFIEQVNFEIEQIKVDIQEIKQRLDEIPTREELQNIKKNLMPFPVLHHNQSVSMGAPPPIQNKQLDLGVLFSEPIFDQIRKKMAATPVDFRSEIQRLQLALKSSLKPDITLKCQLATKQNLKHLMKFSKPKILHIICHGTRQGALQFQDDSRTILGTLQIVKKEQIMQILRRDQISLPKVVFINSCYSEHVGQVFFKMGVNYVIMIDSQDTIEDEAAQIFSQHFYRNIFNGQKVREAFKAAKQRVKVKHNSFGCCCRHSARQKHKPNCRWLQMIRKVPNSDIIDQHEKQQKHKLFHVPSEQCKCELKNLNRHKLSCQWAKQALFHINNDFRIVDENGNARFPKTKAQLPSYLPKDELIICCCFNYEGAEDSNEFRMPHSESNKFKILQNKSNQKSQTVFNISLSTYKQFFDYTSPQLVQTHQKIESSIQGRQRQIYQFMKRLKDLNQTVYIIYGCIGVGRTSFALKTVTYLIQRRIFEMYFYIDLYGIKDKDIFRYKFNEITKFNYDGQIGLREVKNKMIILILDNADDFFELQREQLYQQLKNLRLELHKSKIILTFKQQNCSSFDFEKVHSEKFYLQPLSIPVATRLIFSKMRHVFDISVQYLDIDGLVRFNESLRIPKIIESVCQSFNNVKKKIKIGDLKKKLQIVGDGDFTATKLIQQNLNILRQKSIESYQLLLFISQFSEGISMDDFKMLAFYDKKDGKVHLPINKNWEANFATLFQKIKMEPEKDSTQTSSVTTEEQEFNVPPLKNYMSSRGNNFEYFQIKQGKDGNKIVKGESYFLEEVGQNRFIVKRFIRDFIWKKHVSEQNYYMKHLFVGYMAVMLEIYFKWLVDSKYVHEDLLEYSSISQAGLFGAKNNIFNLSVSLSESIRFAREYNSEFQRIISQHPTILQKIHKSDPSVFIANHKQDFLNIYQKRWDTIFTYLRQNKKRQEKVCLGYLQNLIIFIPTAFKIARVESSLLKYVISKSMSLLSKMKPYSQPKKILTLQLKLQLMRACVDIEKTDIQHLKLDLQFSKEFNIKLLEKIDKHVIEEIKKHWNFERNYLLMYKEYISKKQFKGVLEKSKIPFDKLKIMIETLSEWLGEKWDDAEEILTAKRDLLVGLIFLNILKNSSNTVSVHANAVKVKKEYEKYMFELVKGSALVFKNKDLMKLCLRAKITCVELSTWQFNLKKKSKTGQSLQFYEQLTEKQRQLIECERIYTEKRNNLIGYAQFENQIKSLKKLLKQKLWQQSFNTIICMKSVPITQNGKSPIIQNLARKKNKFRKQIEQVLNPQIDLCAKFQILTKNKLKEEIQNGCTLLVLSTNVKFQNKVPNLVFQGPKMDEDLTPINQDFVRQYEMKKIKILILAGKNSYLAIKHLYQLINDPPIMISLGKRSMHDQMNQFEEINEANRIKSPEDDLRMIQTRKKAQVTFLKEFIRELMANQLQSKEQIVRICQLIKNLVDKFIDVDIQYKRRESPIVIQHVKGSYKDLSPGYQKNHNIDMKIRSQNSNFVVLRRWKQTYRVFDYLSRHLDCQEPSPAYINVFGDTKSGKSSFIHEIARIIVEREKFISGVYIIDGCRLQRKYQGDFESYFNKESQSGKFMTLQDFQRHADQRLILIIDDFHMIKRRSNGRLKLFLQKIYEKRVNMIVVTQQMCFQDRGNKNQKNDLQIFGQIKPIKIDRLSPFQIDLVAYNILDMSNRKLLSKYEQLKAKNQNVRVQDIIKLKDLFYNKKKNQMAILQSRELKKIVSNQN